MPEVCKMCDGPGPLIKAHVIPESLYGPLLQGNDPPLIFSSVDGVHPRRSRTGIYDRGILCGKCDGRIGVWDQYARDLLAVPLKRFGEPSELLRQQNFLIEPVDYSKLKLFFISLLWRADRSTHDFFADVQLGPWEAQARHALQLGEAGTEEHFAIALVRYENRLAATVHNPRRARSLGITVYQFSFPYYEVLIKVDQQPFPENYEEFLLRPTGRLRVALFDYKESANFQDTLQKLSNKAFTN